MQQTAKVDERIILFVSNKEKILTKIIILIKSMAICVFVYKIT